MKKIYIDAILEKNLGDDLFIHILTSRYKEHVFYSQTKFNYNDYKKYKNLKIYSGKYVKYTNKLMSGIFKQGKFLGKILKAKCDYMVSIGGSIFMEWGNIDKIKRHFSIYDKEKPYFILGSNFGPYKTNAYKQFIKENVLRNAQDVCFRDEYSYDLFKDLSNVRHAADIVFTLDTSKIKKTDEKKVIISVIECSRKTTMEDKEKYEKKIIEMSEYFINKNYKVILMSYCKAEKDEEAIESILSRCNNELKSKINTYCYNGNIEEALNVMGDCQIVIGTRFHANIIGLLLGKTIIPIAYSEKTINVLQDMNFKGKILKVQDIENFNVNTLTESDLNYKHDVSEQIKDAQRQFEVLDKLLKRD